MKRRDLLKIIPLAGVGALLSKRSWAGGLTTSDIEGPFYTPGANIKTVLHPSGAVGTSLFLTGTVYAKDCITPVPNALLDVWQANDDGDYDNVGYDFRGKFNADSSGNYAIETKLPGKYLNGNQFRPRHIHFKISGQGSPELTTQLYFDGDTSIPADPWASDPDAVDRIIPLTTDSGGAMHGVWDINLDVDPITSIQEKSRQDAHLVNVYPNPFKDSGTLDFHLARSGRVKIELYDVRGQLVKVIIDETRSPGRHQISLDRSNSIGLSLSSGLYIYKMWNDGQPVDAKRVQMI